MSLFAPASRKRSKARVAIAGPSGSGKTFTALQIAAGLANGGKIAVVDTENGSASNYAGDPVEFYSVEMHPPYHPQKYRDAIKDAQDNGFAVVVLDSVTHAYKGDGGVLTIVDQAAARARGNSFAGWKEGGPEWQRLLDAMIHADIHVVATFRSKTEYVLEADSRGKQTPRKVGMAPEARDGVEYEFTVFAEMDHEHRLVVTKSRCRPLTDVVIERPDDKVGRTLLDWLNEGSTPPASPPSEPEPQPEPEPQSTPEPEPEAPAVEVVEPGMADYFDLDEARKAAFLSKPQTLKIAREVAEQVGVDPPSTYDDVVGWVADEEAFAAAMRAALTAQGGES